MECPKCRLENPPSAMRCDCGYDFASSTMKEPYLTAQEAAENAALTGIGGWLLLPAIGAVLGVLNSVGGAFANPAPFSILFAGFSAVVAVAFFRKHRATPRLFIALLIADALLTLPLVLAPGSLRDRRMEAAMREAVRSVMVAIVWIPYFLNSKRVKLTFVR